MTQTFPGSSEYSVALSVPEDLPEEGTFEMDLRYSCEGESQDEVLGSVHVCLYDPSGQITDANTGDPVKGATVILYLVPSWRPRSGPDDKAPNTCECVNSKDPDEPWGQAAPTRLGVLANPDVDLFNQNAIIEPSMNPQVTGAEGRYSWNVSEGCWYVVVEAQGYLPAVSHIVGVPPAVVDLGIMMHRPRIHLPLLVKSV